MNTAFKEEKTLSQIHVMDQVDAQSRLCYKYNVLAAVMLLVRWTILGRLVNGRAKTVFSLLLVAAVACMSTGCSISLTKNTYYTQTNQPKNGTPRKDMNPKHHTETGLDEKTN